MLKVYAESDISNGYYEGDYNVDGYDVTIDVTCSTCNRLVYRKEVRQDIDIGKYKQEPGKVRR